MNLFSSIKDFFQSYLLAFITAFILLGVTVFIFLDTYNKVKERNELLFELRADNVSAAVEKRMNDYIQVLKSAQALFVVSDTVTLEEWAEFVKVLNVEENYPGVLGIGYAVVIAPDQVAALEERVQSAGFPEYKLWPDSARSNYTSILYLEPFNARNRRAFGFDMFTEPIRRKAMRRAMDSGKPALTGMVKLVQETDVAIQKGFLLYLPLYQQEQPVQTSRQRRSALKGFIFAPFRVKDLIRAIFSNRFTDLDVEIYDGPIIQDELLLFDSNSLNDGKSDLFRIRPIHVATQTWQMQIRAMPGFGYETNFPWFILAGGLIVSSLVFLIMSSLINIRRSNNLRQLITDNATASLFIVNRDDYCTFVNPAAEELTGFSADEIIQQRLHELIHHSHPDGSPFPAAECPIVRALQKKTSFYNHESNIIHKSGKFIQVSINAQPIIENGKLVSHLLEVRDISHEKRSENALREKNQNLQTLNKIGKNLSAELELKKLLQVVTDSCTELTAAQFGAFFYNARRDDEQALMLYSLSGADAKDFENFPIPRATHIFEPTFKGEGVIRSADITKDDRYGKNAPYHGLPENHLPVKSYLAVPVISRGGEVLGGLFFGHSAVDVFTKSAEEIVKGVAAQAAIAIDNSRLFETISHKNEELTKINNDLDNFVYTASHDLKAPVLNIEGLIYALISSLEKNKPERIREIIDKIQLSIQKFKETIHALTQVAKTNKHIDDESINFRMKDLLDDILFSINDMVEDSGATIDLDISCNEVNFSKANMSSILINLFTNAIKYSSPDRTPRISFVCRQEDNNLILRIEDNGLGISESYLDKIFTMFKRYHTHVEGTGIGLYLVKRIVENYGGTVSVESELDRGTTFTIVLPGR
ncbi:multi-sensor signal transduction histidine kinase [Flammeovirgaceae bacterium 311]|nr:multi-sensor signal transduction histidine kinase [Flammeovirgaceae bacterium 311]